MRVGVVLAVTTMARRLALLGLLWQLSGGCGGKAGRPDDGRHQPAPGTLRISSQPSGAAVFRDQHERLGRTPLTLQRPGGTRLDLTLVKEAHAPRPITAVFDSGRKSTLEVTLTPKQCELVVSSAPMTGAEILIDGEPRGRTPNRVSVDADVEHLLEVRKRSFDSYQEKLKLRPGETRQVSAALLRQGSRVAMGVLVLRVNTQAKVYLDGKLLGQTPLPPLPIAAGPHRLRIRGPDDAQEQRRLVLSKGQRLELFVELRPGRAR